MHRFFANWYSLARPEPPSDTLDKRWAGIESYCEGIETKNVFELARLFFARPVRDESSEEKFRQSFKDADSAFLMKDNSLEVQVLAGAAIVNILDQTPSHVTDATALAVLSANCRGLRSEGEPDAPRRREREAMAVPTRHGAIGSRPRSFACRGA